MNDIFVVYVEKHKVLRDLRSICDNTNWLPFYCSDKEKPKGYYCLLVIYPEKDIDMYKFNLDLLKNSCEEHKSKYEIIGRYNFSNIN